MTTQGLNKDMPIVAVVGFTASGKSALGMHLAKQFSGEIIAADAMTIYKDFDIGTAKPSQKEQSEIQHHMLDIVAASSNFSVAKFKPKAEKIITEIAKRGNLPILVGGSGLYSNSILYDYDFRKPPVSTKVRAELNTKTHDELIAIASSKNLSIENIDTHNKRRLIRLIESEGEVSAPKPLRENTLILGLDVPRAELRQRIEARVDKMFAHGLEDEVKKLSQQYGWDVEPMRSIGYREWRKYFENSKPIDEVKNTIIIHTMQLAKKQRTWFKRNNSIKWVNNFDEAVEYTTTFLNK